MPKNTKKQRFVPTSTDKAEINNIFKSRHRAALALGLNWYQYDKFLAGQMHPLIQQDTYKRMKNVLQS